VVWKVFELREGHTAFLLPEPIPADSVRIRTLDGDDAAVRKYLDILTWVEFRSMVL
jgi:hypothetical protein